MLRFKVEIHTLQGPVELTVEGESLSEVKEDMLKEGYNILSIKPDLTLLGQS